MKSGLFVYVQSALGRDALETLDGVLGRDLLAAARDQQRTPAVPDRTARSLDIICENITRFAAGEPMLNVLTKEDMYLAPGR